MRIANLVIVALPDCAFCKMQAGRLVGVSGPEILPDDCRGLQYRIEFSDNNGLLIDVKHNKVQSIRIYESNLVT